MWIVTPVHLHALHRPYQLYCQKVRQWDKSLVMSMLQTVMGCAVCHLILSASHGISILLHTICSTAFTNSTYTYTLTHTYIYMCVCVCLSACISIHPSIHPSILLHTICSPAYTNSTYTYTLTHTYMYMCVSVCLHVYLSIHPSIHPSIHFIAHNMFNCIHKQHT